MSTEFHKKMSKLFEEDPETFEKKQKKLIEEVITSAPKGIQLKLRLSQAKFDKLMRGAGSGENRLAQAQGVLWSHFIDVFDPAMQEFSKEMNDKLPSSTG